MTTRRTPATTLSIFAAITLMLAALAVLVPTAAATVVFSETFEAVTVGNDPSGSGYTFSNGPAHVVNTQAHAGSKSADLGSIAPYATFTTSPNDNLCTSGNSVSWWERLGAYPASGGNARTFFSGSSSVDPPTIDILDNGAVRIGLSSGAGGYATMANVMPLNVWVSFTFTVSNCTTNVYTLDSSAQPAPVSSPGTAGGQPPLQRINFQRSSVSGSWFLDDLVWGGSSPPGGTLVSDDFEGETIGATPSGFGYTWTPSDVTPTIDSTHVHLGTRAVKMTSVASTTNTNALVTANDLCANSLDFWLYFTTMPASGKVFHVIIDSRPTPYTFPTQLYVNDQGSVGFFITTGVSGADQLVADGLVPNTWEEFTITANCSTGYFAFSSTTLDPSFGAFPKQYNSQVGPADYYTSQPLKNLRWNYANKDGGAPVAGFTVWLDDLGSTTPAQANVVLDNPGGGNPLFTSHNVVFNGHLTTGTTPQPVDHFHYSAERSDGITYECRGYTAPDYACTMSLPNDNGYAGSVQAEAADGTAVAYQANPSATTPFRVNAATGASSTHLTAPTNGALLPSGVPVHFAGTMTDPGNLATKVKFTASSPGNVATCIDTTSPYACDMNLIDGTYTAKMEGLNNANVVVATQDNSQPTFSLGVVPPTPTHVAVTNLRGFDVDDSGIIAIARLENGKKVQVFSGQTLSAGNSATDNDCDGKLDGVSTYTTSNDVYTTYFECDNTSPHPANALKIRSGNLGDPFIPSPCNTEFNGDTITSANVNVPDTLREISGLTAFPIDFSKCNTKGFDSVGLSWGFSTTNGQVGVFMVEKIHGHTDNSDSAFVTFDAGTSPDVAQMCGWAFNGVDHMGAVGLDATTGFYLPTAQDTGGSVNPSGVADAGIGLDYHLGGTYALSKALSCAKARAIIANKAGTSVSVICTIAGQCPSGKTIGQSIWTNGAAAPVDARAAAISGNAAWAAYMDADAIHIVNATDGHQVLSMPRPEAGIFWDMRLDYSGGGLWLAYTDNIYRYNISNSTCGTNCTNIIQTLPTPTSSSSLTGSVGDNANALGDVFGGGSVGGALMLAIIYVLLFSVGCFFIFNERIIGAVIGGVCGLAFTIFSGLIPPVITFLIVAIMIGLGAMRFWQGRSDGGM